LKNFRLRSELSAGREAAKAFWRTEVLREGRERVKCKIRKEWQLEGSVEVMSWYEGWPVIRMNCRGAKVAEGRKGR
jgi:hypothetical protein